MERNIVTAIYFHPEAYPPTLNAIGELSKIAGKVSVLHRPHLQTIWNYPANVTLHPSGAPMGIREQEMASIFKKLRFFFSFTRTLYRLIKKEKPALVLVYDNMSLLALSLIRPFISKKISKWYHNHDVVEPGALRKFSLGWFSVRAEKRAFRWLQIFSLPANERKQYFPLEQFKGQYFFLPNLPSLAFYGQLQALRTAGAVIKLLYQGRISEGHGLEEIIPLLGNTINDKPLQLLVAGSTSQEYRATLEKLAEAHGVTNKLVFAGYIPYRELPVFTGSCHIGIAVNKPIGIIYQTGGTASNKIYEYMACGLPVLYFDNTHYKESLGAYTWAFATDLSNQQLLTVMSTIDSRYEELGTAALADFKGSLNYEKHFEPVARYLIHHILN